MQEENPGMHKIQTRSAEVGEGKSADCTKF